MGENEEDGEEEEPLNHSLPRRLKSLLRDLFPDENENRSSRAIKRVDSCKASHTKSNIY